MKQTKQTEQKFKKCELLKAEQYREKRDLLNALLADGQEYTLSEADAAIEKFMKGKVK